MKHKPTNDEPDGPLVLKARKKAGIPHRDCRPGFYRNPGSWAHELCTLQGLTYRAVPRDDYWTRSSNVKSRLPLEVGFRGMPRGGDNPG